MSERRAEIENPGNPPVVDAYARFFLLRGFRRKGKALQENDALRQEGQQRQLHHDPEKGSFCCPRLPSHVNDISSARRFYYMRPPRYSRKGTKRSRPSAGPSGKRGGTRRLWSTMKKRWACPRATSTTWLRSRLFEGPAASSTKPWRPYLSSKRPNSGRKARAWHT